jgi:hypothetical protein
MKHSLVLLAAVFSFQAAVAQNEVACAFTSINADITSNTTLSASTLYRIEGCIKVTNGATLTVPAGTIIMGEKASTGTLIIDKGAELIVTGTSTDPVVFTSDQKPGHRNPGDWGGIVLLGDAPVNVGSTMTVSKNRVCPLTAGGSTPADNSGSISYLRIEYPVYGLTMVGVGSATQLSHIQVSEASQTSFDIHGGAADFKKFISLNARRNDVLASAGNVGKAQYILGLRLDANAYVSDGELSNGIVFANNYDSSNNFVSALGKPDNSPMYSNVTLLGPGYCHEEYDNNFKNGVLYFQNTKGGIFNSVIAKWREGLLLDGQQVIDNADAGTDFYFAYNTFYGNLQDYASDPLWSGTCAADMDEWITGTGASFCEQLGNQFNPTNIGLDNSFCGNLCENRPILILDSDPLTYRIEAPDYSSSPLTDPFFEASIFRGALNDSADWTADWANFCPQNAVYCTEPAMKTLMGAAPKQSREFTIYPNPAQASFVLSFPAFSAGKANVQIVDYRGRTMLVKDYPTVQGANHLEIETKNWANGIYFVQLSNEGKIQTAKLVIK